MIDVKQAIANAKGYAATLLDITHPNDLLLEEVHSTDKSFEITLSFPDRTSPFSRNVGPAYLRPDGIRREYKTFEVSKETGDVIGMSIRQIA